MSGDMTTWRKRLESAREQLDDASKIVAVAPSEDVLDVEFDGGFGLAEGGCILVWSEDYVYFPVTYDGFEYLGSAPRNPQAEGQGHEGGE